MNQLLESSSWILWALLYVAAAVFFFLGLLWFVRKRLPHEDLRKHHDVAGFVFSIIGILYSVILGFTVINVQTRYNDAEQIIHTEAMALADLYRIAGSFPIEFRDSVRKEMRAYVDFVVHQEWKENSSADRHLATQPILEQIWMKYAKVDVPDLKASVCYTHSMSALDKLMDARLSRAFNSWEYLSGMLWTILIIGGFLTICFMYFFSLENFRLQMLMTSILAGYLSFMLFLVYSLDHVYEGPQGIQPVAFQEVTTLFDEWDKE